jgi:hypothetical protein
MHLHRWFNVRVTVLKPFATRSLFVRVFVSVSFAVIETKIVLMETDRMSCLSKVEKSSTTFIAHILYATKLRSSFPHAVCVFVNYNSRLKMKIIAIELTRSIPEPSRSIPEPSLCTFPDFCLCNNETIECICRC